MAAPMGAFVYHIKEPHVMTTSSSDSSSGFTSSRDGISAQDKLDMANMGKKQQFKRNFSLLSILSFTVTMMCTWEGVLFSSKAALVNGSASCLFYGFIVCFIGSTATALSLAELVSIAPTASGQFHWVHNMLSSAPYEYRHFLSWFTGWLSLCGWQALVATEVYLVSSMINGVIVLNDGVEPIWRTTSGGFAVILVCSIINVLGGRAMPRIEGLLLIFQLLAYFAILIPLLHLAPRSPPSFVFGASEIRSGWDERPGIAWSVGMVSVLFPFVGYDGPIHLAEEVHNAAEVVPKAMVYAVIANGLFGLGMVIAFLFSLGNIEAAISSPTGYPFLYSFYNATEHKTIATGMAGVVIVMSVFATLSVMASASRQTWAFARDKAIPCHSLLSRVCPKNIVPNFATALTAGIAIVITVLQLGSTNIFNSFLSTTVAGLYLSYLIPISLLLWKRFRHAPIDFGPWKMEYRGYSWGWIANAVSVVFIVWLVIFSFFPQELPVTSENMNWSCVFFAVAVAVGALVYVFHARKHYHGPQRRDRVISGHRE